MSWRQRGFRLIVGLGVASLVMSLIWMLVGDRFEVIKSVGPDTFSRSALGHSAFKHALEGANLNVQVSQNSSADRAKLSSLLIVAEPFLHLEDETSAERFEAMLSSTKPVLIVLPKRWGRPSAENEGFVDDNGLHPLPDVLYVLQQTLPNAQLHRATGSSDNWSTEVFPNGPALSAAQTFSSERVNPLIWNDDGILLGEFWSVNGGWVTLLSDPDLLATHGIDEGLNQDLALAIVRYAMAESGPIVIDETLHGHGRQPSIGKALTEFPLALLTTQFLLLMVLTLWSISVRFGAPRSLVHGLPLGKALSIANTAELIDSGGHMAYATHTYVLNTLEDVARRLNLSKDLTMLEKIRKLESVSKARGSAVDLVDIYSQSERASWGDRRTTRRALLGLARSIHKWKQEILK